MASLPPALRRTSWPLRPVLAALVHSAPHEEWPRAGWIGHDVRFAWGPIPPPTAAEPGTMWVADPEAAAVLATSGLHAWPRTRWVWPRSMAPEFADDGVERGVDPAALRELAPLIDPGATPPPCVLVDSTGLVAVCGAWAAAEGEVEIEVDVAERARGRGLGQRMAAAYIGDVLAAGLRPRWDSGTEASERLARRLGFRVSRRWVAWVSM